MRYLFTKEHESYFKLRRAFHWCSLYGSAQSLALIELAKTKQQVILVIADDIKDYNKIYNSLNFFNQDLTILRFDNWEVLAFDHFSPHPDITSNRLSTLYKLQDLKRGIVITTLESLSQRLCPLEYVNSYSFELNCGDDLSLESFTKNLHKIGYNRVNSVMEHGEYSVKGSLIDLYPMGSRLPYRVDLFDQEIESIRTFDPTTQLSINLIKKIHLLPAREFSIEKSSIETFKENYIDIFNDSDGFIFNEVSQYRFPGGIEFYLPLFFKNTNTLFQKLIGYMKTSKKGTTLQKAT